MNRILFVKIFDSSFVLQDEEILKKHFLVTSYSNGINKGIRLIINQIKLFFFLVLNIHKYNLIFIWFADFQSVLPSLFSKLLSKKTIIVLGGYDVAKIPSISYGAHISKIRSLAIKTSAHFADILLPVSNYVLQQAEINISKNISKKATIVYNAIDTDFYNYKNELKHNQVVTACVSNDMKRAELKGALHYIDVAKRLPEIEFLMVGIGNDIFQEISELAPSNVNIKQFLTKEELRNIYNASKVVCQLSTIESFGMVVAEGMACKCVPVVNNVGGLKEVVKHYGYKVDRDNIEHVALTIQEAITHFDEKCKYIDAYIQGKFSIKEREMRLLEIVKQKL